MRNAFQTSAKIYLSEKKIGVRCTFNASFILRIEIHAAVRLVSNYYKRLITAHTTLITNYSTDKNSSKSKQMNPTQTKSNNRSVCKMLASSGIHTFPSGVHRLKIHLVIHFKLY